MKRRRPLLSVFMLAWVAHLWRVISNGVKPFDWLVWVTEVVVVVLIAYDIWIQPVLVRRARQRKLAATFGMTFDDESIAKTMPVGTGTVDVNVKITYPIAFTQLDLRFVENASGDPVAENGIVRVTAIVYRTPPTLEWFENYADEKGGYNAHWRPPVVRQAGEVLRFRVGVESAKPWKGFLSLRSYDADNQSHFVRRPFEFVGSATIQPAS